MAAEISLFKQSRRDICTGAGIVLLSKDEIRQHVILINIQGQGGVLILNEHELITM